MLLKIPLRASSCMPYMCTCALVTSAKWGCEHWRCRATFGSFLSGLCTPALSVLLLETTTLWSLRDILVQGPSTFALLSVTSPFVSYYPLTHERNTAALMEFYSLLVGALFKTSTIPAIGFRTGMIHQRRSPLGNSLQGVLGSPWISASLTFGYGHHATWQAPNFQRVMMSVHTLPAFRAELRTQVTYEIQYR
jgi:hypothetical protein